MPDSLGQIRVLDMSRILAGPWASQTLADMGADVIKVERPGKGDDTRSWGPPYVRDRDGNNTSESAYFLCANRGKRSICVDISRQEGQELIRQFIPQTDVIIENYKVGGLKKYGLDYDALRELNPGLIYCSITGFGQTGPYADQPGYDFLIQAMGGLMSITGEKDGLPGGGPQKAGVALADITTGLYASIAILAALVNRQQTGQGDHIDLSLLDVQAAVLANQAMNYLTTGVVPQRQGNGHPNIVPYQGFATADGHIILAIGNDEQFARLCKVIGQPELATDPRYSSNRERVSHRDTLVPILEQALYRKTAAEWLARFRTEQIPSGPINSIDKVFADPQIRHRGMQKQLAHPLAGSVEVVASPIRFSHSRSTSHRAPPLLGEHTDEVMTRVLGMDEGRIRDLHRRGVIQ